MCRTPCGLQLQAVKHLGDLRDRDQVKLATKRDQGGAALRASLDHQQLIADNSRCGGPVIVGVQ